MPDSTPEAHDWPVLSIRQPWAELILAGLKKYESRGWETLYRGPLWLHASLRIDPGSDIASAELLPRGAVVGVIVLKEIIGIKPKDAEEYDGLHGPLHWRVEPLHRLPRPVAARGRLNLWRLTPTLFRQCFRQLPQ